MSRRHPRDGIRDRWVAAIAAAEIGNAAKVVLLYLIATGRVSERGAITFQREAVAYELGMHPQRVSKCIRESRDAGLIDRRGGGYRGRTSEYVVVVPSRSAGAA